jgi:hypothetical protein
MRMDEPATLATSAIVERRSRRNRTPAICKIVVKLEMWGCGRQQFGNEIEVALRKRHSPGNSEQVDYSFVVRGRTG